MATTNTCKQFKVLTSDGVRVVATITAYNDNGSSQVPLRVSQSLRDRRRLSTIVRSKVLRRSWWSQRSTSNHFLIPLPVGKRLQPEKMAKIDPFFGAAPDHRGVTF